MYCSISCSGAKKQRLSSESKDKGTEDERSENAVDSNKANENTNNSSRVNETSTDGKDKNETKSERDECDSDGSCEVVGEVKPGCKQTTERDNTAEAVAGPSGECSNQRVNRQNSSDMRIEDRLRERPTAIDFVMRHIESLFQLIEKQ